MSLSNVWFASDLHIGHTGIAKHRGFASIEEHDEEIIQNFSVIGKKDKLFILGDVVWGNKDLPRLKEIPGVKELIIGNHDGLMTKEYLKYFTKVHGFRKYKHFWLSHAPIHPQEIFRCRGNIHGHLHKGASTPPLDMPYYNVNVDYNKMLPTNFKWILDSFDEWENK